MVIVLDAPRGYTNTEMRADLPTMGLEIEGKTLIEETAGKKNDAYPRSTKIN